MTFHDTKTIQIQFLGHPGVLISPSMDSLGAVWGQFEGKIRSKTQNLRVLPTFKHLATPVTTQ